MGGALLDSIVTPDNRWQEVMGSADNIYCPLAQRAGNALPTAARRSGQSPGADGGCTKVRFFPSSPGPIMEPIYWHVFLPHERHLLSLIKEKTIKKISAIITALTLSISTNVNAMDKVTFLGQTVYVRGSLPAVGKFAPEFQLTNEELKEITISDFGKARKVLNIFVSIDTPVCDSSVRKFNEMVASLPNTVMIGISNDLPFAQKRFCGAANIKNVTMLSAFRSPAFAANYGVSIPDGALKGLTTRAVVVLDENNKVIYSQRFKEIAEDPDYTKVLEVLKAP